MFVRPGNEPHVSGLLAGDELLGSGVEPLDLGGEVIDLVEQNVGELGVVLIEPADERLDQGGVLDPQPTLGQFREYARVTFTEDQRGEHGPGGDAHDVGGDRGLSLYWHGYRYVIGQTTIVVTSRDMSSSVLSVEGEWASPPFHLALVDPNKSNLWPDAMDISAWTLESPQEVRDVEMRLGVLGVDDLYMSRFRNEP